MAKSAIDDLAPLLGEWRIEAFGETGRAVFERTLDGAFLLQRTEIDLPEAPDTLSIIASAAGGEGFTQHYFDSRGVVRTYKMSFSESVWTLTRELEDFSPLDFRQRYTGRLSDDGRRIDGAWEINHGEKWEKDFDLTYIRLD